MINHKPVTGGGVFFDMVKIEREIRGIPLWLLRDYLVSLGGERQENDIVHGPGWQAWLSQLADLRSGSTTVGQVKLVIEGEAEGVERLMSALELRLMRAGN